MYPVLFTFWGYTFHSYGAAMILAFIICITLVIKDIPEYLNFNDVLNFCLITIASIFVGDKIILKLITNDFHSLLDILKFWEHGNHSFYGTMLITILSISVYCKIKKIQVLSTLDFLFHKAVLGLAIQRTFGCFMAGCCYGKPTTLVWGLRFSESSPAGEIYPDIPLHPTQLYYGLSALLIYIFLSIYKKKKREHGNIMAAGIAGLSFSYFIIAFFRGDIFYINFFLGLTLNQCISIIIFFGGLMFLCKKHLFKFKKIVIFYFILFISICICR